MVFIVEWTNPNRRVRAFHGLILLLIALLPSCGGGTSVTMSPASYAVTVTASANAGALQHTVQINVKCRRLSTAVANCLTRAFSIR